MAFERTSWEKFSRLPGAEGVIGDFRGNLRGEPDFLQFVWNKWPAWHQFAGAISLATETSTQGRAPGRRGRAKNLKIVRRHWEEAVNATAHAYFSLIDAADKDRTEDWGIPKADFEAALKSLEHAGGIAGVAMGRGMSRGAPPYWTRYFWCAALLPHVGTTDGWWDWFARWLHQLGEDVPKGGGTALNAWWKKSKRTLARLLGTKGDMWRDVRLDALPPFKAANLYPEWKGFKPGSSARKKHDALVLKLMPFIRDSRAG